MSSKLSQIGPNSTILPSRFTTINTNNLDSRTWRFLEGRRQNHLNSLFNIRKNRLTGLTKANRLIHERINTQQSYYPILRILGHQNYELGTGRAVSSKLRQRIDQNKRKLMGPIAQFIGLPINEQYSECLQMKKKRNYNLNSKQNSINTISESIISRDSVRRTISRQKYNTFDIKIKKKSLLPDVFTMI